MEEQPAYTWTPPTYDFSQVPTLNDKIVTPGESRHNFARKAIWSPDGLSILAQCEDHSFKTLVFDEGSASIRIPFRQSAPALDCAWYPGASSSVPATYCFAASVRECPVKLLDALDGRLRASYSIVDHRERQVAPHSLAFSPGGDRLYCGYDSAFEVFDVSRPGEDGVRVLTSPAKTSKDGIKGIVSSLSHAPSTKILAVGSLTPSPWNIALYDIDDEHIPSMYIGLGPQRPAGVTQVLFNPMYPDFLYASFRRREGIYAWDLRNPDNGPCTHYIFGQSTKSLTSQRHFFSIDVTGHWLSVGDEDGQVHTWDLTLTDPIVDPTISFIAHADSVPSVSFHPFEAKLLSGSGGRHFPHDESSDSESDKEDTGGTRRQKLRPITKDSSLKVWDCTPSTTSPPIEHTIP